VSERYNWDGSLKEEYRGGTLGFSAARTMWLHRQNHSATLRRDALTRCRYCGLLMEYFTRYDQKRLPVVPKLIRAVAVPARMRWHVMSGVAFPGDGGSSHCYVPHPAFCPRVEHDDDDLSLAEARAVFRRKSDELIASGQFIPDLAPARCEDEVAEQYVQDVGDVRHVIAYGRMLWLAPSRIDTLQCVARADSTGERCRNLVWTQDGSWEEMEIPYAPGRAGQQVLWAGMTMWVFALHTLYPAEFSRWMKQRCPSHDSGYIPDAVPPQWVHFDPLRHDAHILRQRPSGVVGAERDTESVMADLRLGPRRTECATPGCGNGSVSQVPEGWVCSFCQRRRERRDRTHQKWVDPRDGNIP
jgi:hypothetical protein